MEKPKYVYTEKEGNASVTLTVDVDENTIQNMMSLITVSERILERLKSDLNQLKKDN